jgi:dephospho-CoA kinase
MRKLSPNLIRLSPSLRLYKMEQPIVALTGGIACGKTSVSKIVSGKGIKVIDADALVKGIYQTPEAKDFIRNLVPHAWETDQIDFSALRKIVFSDETIKNQVESFIYTRLPQAFKTESQKIQGQDFIFYDVPLLFERNLESLVDVRVVVYTPRELQLKRLMERDHSDEESALKILRAQLDIELKKNQADLVINNSGTLSELKENVDEFIKRLLF